MIWEALETSNYTDPKHVLAYPKQQVTQQSCSEDIPPISFLELCSHRTLARHVAGHPSQHLLAQSSADHPPCCAQEALRLLA